ncbi:hypothetical protein QO058_26160 [Bosea vestrisii]|uniref:hypothetical protein n=1 Tax=Bosea vestrisii TaxID=151416 RepID=UPI0024DF4301|nr:hypothetical protein [Bosea vestrisii]WID96178.1 hypothetical protein QO058_26160 [Bosea vestrisii]
MSITASVGLGGKNTVPDTRLIQASINPHVKALGVDLLEVDGLCGPLTRSAIKRYQQVFLKMTSPDSRVDPGGKTVQHIASNPAPADAVFTASRSPSKLKIGDFTQVPVVMDPADGTVQDAYTAFAFDIPDHGVRMAGTDYALGVPNEIDIWPAAQLKIGVTLTPALLAHEQFHYDVGFVIARQLARELTALRAASIAALVQAYVALADLHFQRRAGLIQARYDKDTQHSANAKYQRIWLDRMTACLGNEKANQIGGFWL